MPSYDLYDLNDHNPGLHRAQDFIGPSRSTPKADGSTCVDDVPVAEFTIGTPLPGWRAHYLPCVKLKGDYHWRSVAPLQNEMEKAQHLARESMFADKKIVFTIYLPKNPVNER